MQRLGLRAKRLIYSLMWYNTIVQLFWMQQKIEFNWLNTKVPAYSEICIRAGCESFVPFDAAFSAARWNDDNLMRTI